MSITKVVAVIPARMGSSRFPGKPLLQVSGLPMIEHVRRRTLLCEQFEAVVVATCDTEISTVVESFGGKVIMTSPNHKMASDRVAEAVDRLECTHVVNVQGDEILILPEDLSKIVKAIISEPSASAWNAIAKIDFPEELSDSSIVKCLVSTSGRIMYCSRVFSHLRVSKNFEPVRKILGILGYSREFLEKFGRLARTPLEIAESIDQSRILEYDIPLCAVSFSKGYPGINEPREVAVVKKILDQDLRQSTILEKILAWDNQKTSPLV